MISSGADEAPSFRVTKALGRSPQWGWGIPMTVHSSTAGQAAMACSTSMLEMFSPPEMMMSMPRSRNSMFPSGVPYGLWGAISLLFPVTCADRQPSAMMITRVSPSALPDLRPARRLADPAGPVNGVQGHRAPCAAARGCRAAPQPSPAMPGLGRPRGPRRPQPAPASKTADAPAGHARHSAAVAPPPGHQEMDLSAPDGPPAGQRRDRRAHRA